MTTHTSPRAPLGSVGTLVDSQIRRLQQGYLTDRSDAVATLARLRRGAGRAPLAVPDLWAVIDLQGLSSDPQLKREDAQVPAQNAVYAALTLWALHQQSRQQPMHRRDGRGLGGTVRCLMPDNEIDEAVRKRFVRAGSAPTWDALMVRLRDVVALLRRKEISLDYALLADQLHAWQLPHRRAGVRDSWGRSFHTRHPGTNASEDGADDTDVDTIAPKEAL